MKERRFVAFHGDICIRQIDDIPKSAMRNVEHDGILARGEITGHSHRVSVGPGGEKVEFFGATGAEETFMKVPASGATVTHEEHNALVLTGGLYKSDIAREYDHFGEEARNVTD
jgi:hypothetical protein